MKVCYESFSECGPRHMNEDHIAIREMAEESRSVFVLCDGMGGHDFGEVASRLVAEHICDYWIENTKHKDSVEKVMDACDDVMNAFNRKSNGEMGTTMAMVAIEGKNALLAHCGDTRIYVVRDKKIIYQSTDHVALTEEGYPIITRGFFTRRNNYAPDVKEIALQVKDKILICSDGVYGNGKWSDLNDAMKDDSSISPIERVKKIASEHAHDNYSAIIICICDE